MNRMEDDSDAGDVEPRPKGLLGRLRAAASGILWVEAARTIAPMLLLSAIVIAVALHFVRPAPPRQLTIASGAAGSRFNLVALRYQAILARSGIKLNVLTTEGSLDNINRLLAPDSGVDIALVQSGIADAGEASDLVSLGSMFYVPLTIFYRSPHVLQRLSQLRGHRIAIGQAGSGTRALALALLKANGIEPDGPTKLLDMEGAEARTELLGRRADAIFLAGDSASPETIREMLHAPGVRLFEFPQADAYVRRFRYLSKLDLPPGALDLGENLPPRHINMLASTVELVAHPSLHPALSDLMMEAATEVHGGASLLQNAGQFPAPLVHDFPVSADAARYYKSGKSFAYRYLPFWLASLLDRALVVMLPALLVVIPIIRYIPEIFDWRIRRRISRRYAQLMALERQSLEELTAEQRAVLIDRLAHIERAVIALKMPGSHANQLYVLRQHMQFVRENLGRPVPAADQK
ncbi:MAG: TAXI family TRAP transporter solute-binding subunit [Steroidobacterales bacterium]